MSDTEHRGPIEVKPFDLYGHYEYGYLRKTRSVRSRTWREQLRLVWRSSIVRDIRLMVFMSVMAMLIYLVAFHRGVQSIIPTPEQISQQAAWKVSVAVFEKCFEEFAKPIPRSKIDLRVQRSGACARVAEIGMNERYEIGINKGGE